MSGRWAILSARGGAGVSTLCVNLARAFALGGERTLLCDLAPTVPSLDILTGVGESIVYTLPDIAAGVSANDVRVALSLGDERRSKKAPPPSPLWLLPLSAGEKTDERTLGAALARGLRDLRPRAAVIDTEPRMLSAVAPTVDGVLLAVTADEISLRAAEALVQTSLAEGLPLCGFVLCRALLSRDGAAGTPPLDIVDRLGLPLVGILPQSEILREASVPVGMKRYAHADFVRAVYNLRDRLCGRMTPLLQGILPDGISREDYLTRA